MVNKVKPLSKAQKRNQLETLLFNVMFFWCCVILIGTLIKLACYLIDTNIDTNFDTNYDDNFIILIQCSVFGMIFSVGIIAFGIIAFEFG